MENNSTVELAKQRLNDWLSQGAIAPGDKLPSERELGELLNIKRMTLRQALLFLESESRIFRKDRRGWFAALPRFNYNPNSSTSFKQAAIEQGRCPSWGYMTKERVLSAPAPIAELLHVDEGTEIYKICGWGALDNHIVFYHETFISPLAAPEFIERLGERSFAEVWESAYGIATHTRHLAFKPTRLSGDACKVMGGNASTPSILVEKHRADAQRRIVQVDIEYWRFESVDFFINL
ncbi:MULTISPECIES: GntR family transcriptional regulator [Serratia]|jgi:DNA-binding GntR family transcriptional regulator|uniref:UTRA domain-containing protein n=1 Tax=Serratia grimesii TaxID=82995 RepID=A0A7G2JUB1_9GAMM|nr:GntR family transcriptional regulator [Serratia grimesii]CAI1035152.1 HTH-type transcriptional regulator frlR [Serratia grimesii]CAI1099404.1 HTH-type transcriptional regulator frlR [Serratia grimesii]CAI1106956.1 HTH-type transcriptional regulator frlR [Serratia grimesii]CAI2511982.1 HTH-type transcriptional regulator frlR [Serratia grimesii]CUW23143.1 Putative transcriptional regulator of 2-aminoethylphosphonate degradation operons [Serratia grimesii]